MAAFRTAFVVAVAVLNSAAAFGDDGLKDHAPVSEADARQVCIVADALGEAACKVTAFGPIGTLSGRSFAYAAYEYRLPTGTLMDMRAIVFERAGAERWRPLFAPINDGGLFETPTMIRTRAGVLLHIPGHESGTGNFNRERLYVWRGAWKEIDTTSWLKDLERRLPKGLGAWKGIYPDYARLRAAMPFWRQGDSNAEPTGGSAVIRLALRADKIVLKSVALRRAMKRRARSTLADFAQDLSRVLAQQR